MIKITTHSIPGSLVLDEKEIVSIQKTSSRTAEVRGESSRVTFSFNAEKTTNDFVAELHAWKHSTNDDGYTQREEYRIDKIKPPSTEKTITASELVRTLQHRKDAIEKELGVFVKEQHDTVSTQTLIQRMRHAMARLDELDDTIELIRTGVTRK